MGNATANDAITLEVNGARRETRAAPATPLLYVLRNDLGLAATRFGCGTEQCGACVVLADGKPVYACTLPVSEAARHRITTLEGLARAGAPHPLQAALIEAQAAQCGYCIPGIAMRAAALLASTPEPSEDEVRAALDGHLCRCGSHNRIVRAVLQAARMLAAEAR